MASVEEGGDTRFGKCCQDLNDAMSGGQFEPLITVDDGVLYMSVGLLEAEGDEPNMIDHPIFFCPFCGAKLQSPEDVDKRIGDSQGED
jgi:hypothetical protein